MNRKIRIQCPCGYILEAFGSKNKAVAMIKIHFKIFHKDLLPFGITDEEAKRLLTEINDKTQLKLKKSNPAKNAHDLEHVAV